MKTSLHLPFRRTKSSADHNSWNGQQLISTHKSPVIKTSSLHSDSQASLSRRSSDTSTKSGIIKYIQNKIRRSSLSSSNSDTECDHGFLQSGPCDGKWTVAARQSLTNIPTVSEENDEEDIQTKEAPQLTLRARRSGLWPLTLNNINDEGGKAMTRQSAVSSSSLNLPPEVPPRVPERSPVSLGLVPPTPTSRLTPRTPQSCSSLSSYEVPLGLDEAGQMPFPSPSTANRPAQCCASKNYKPLLSSILSEDAPPEEEAPPPPSTSLPPLSNEGYSIRTELRKLSKCGWYWGPITRSDAEAKLCNKPDGTFLVRNSLDQNYILSLSFRSLGQSLHARIEYSNGRFSFCPRLDDESFSSVVDLVEKAMEKATVCYSRGRDPNSPTFPVRLLYPISRLSGVPSLKYLCRFAVRLDVPADYLEDIRLPDSIRKYLSFQSFEHPLVSWIKEK